MPLRQVLLGLVHTGQRQQVLRPPRQSVLLRHRRKGKQVDGRFKQIQHWRRLLGGDGKGKSLIAARRFPFEVCSDSPQAGIAGLTVFILADKYGIVVGIALIEPTGSDAEINQFIVDSSAVQILDGMGGAAADLRQKQCLCLLRLLAGTRNGRLPSRPSHDPLHRLGKGNLFHFDQIIQCRPAANPTGKPAPLPVGNFQAVVLTGAVGAAAKMHQLLRLIGLEIGQ